jgi:hypothetical protein
MNVNVALFDNLISHLLISLLTFTIYYKTFFYHLPPQIILMCALIIRVLDILCWSPGKLFFSDYTTGYNAMTR